MSEQPRQTAQVRESSAKNHEPSNTDLLLAISAVTSTVEELKKCQLCGESDHKLAACNKLPALQARCNPITNATEPRQFAPRGNYRNNWGRGYRYSAPQYRPQAGNRFPPNAGQRGTRPPFQRGPFPGNNYRGENFSPPCNCGANFFHRENRCTYRQHENSQQPTTWTQQQTADQKN